ncbi:MAG TPA: phosphotransferase [Syntrophales bacterium]|nr:phosphotransferase [Syntrophales bacterium]
MKRLNNEMLSFLLKSLGIRKSAKVRSTPIARGGSNRSFHRIAHEFGTSIFMVYDIAREENRYYAAIADFLRSIGVPVPGIIVHDPEKGFILMDDLGDRDLWSYREEPWTERGLYYRKTLSAIHRLHAFPVQDFPIDTVPLMEAFGPNLYKWERDYFFDNSVDAVCGITISEAERTDLEAELEGLAGRLLDMPVTLVHRDLQSQNVMVYNDRAAFVDFQGMRFGNPLYDLGSLLYDPYVSFAEDQRVELLRYYHELSTDREDAVQNGKWGGAGDVNYLPTDWRTFEEGFRDAASQRLMQALGAYGFLGLKKGLSGFLAHIPAGIANLIDSASRSQHLPLLKKLAINCQRSLARRIS